MSSAVSGSFMGGFCDAGLLAMSYKGSQADYSDSDDSDSDEQVEQPKVEAASVEQPKIEAASVEQPKVEAPSVEEPKVEAPSVDGAEGSRRLRASCRACGQ